MRACEKWSRPPSALLGGTEWGERDHLLILAYQRYLDTTCSECGGYALECRNPENNGVYTVVDDTYCYRAAELHSVTRAAGFKPDDGQLLYVEEIDADVVTRPPFSLFEGGEDALTESDADHQQAEG